jgi:hypothetical protein
MLPDLWTCYQKDDKPSAALVTAPSYSVDANWYSDTGTTDHITNDLECLVVRDKYHGKEHQSMIYIFTISLMLLKQTNICCMCTALLVIIMYSLNFIRIIFLLRIQPRRSLCFEVDVLAASTLRRCMVLRCPQKPSFQLSLQLISGIGV